MAVAFGSAGTYLAFTSGRTTSVLAPPASIANGDLLIAFVFNGHAGTTSVTPTPPAGWSTLSVSPVFLTDGSFNAKASVFYKIASSESGSYTFTHNDSTYSSCGVVIRYTGVDTTTPLSPTSTANNGTGTTATATGFTTTNANTFIVFAEMDWADNTTNTTPPTGTTPTFTERIDDTLIYVADGTLAAAGATGNKSHTCNSASGNPWAAYLIGLKPAAGVGTTLTADAGSYTLTGTSAGLAGKAIASAGSYTLTGFAATLAGKALASGGSYALTGSAASFTTGYPSALNTGPTRGTVFTPFSGDLNSSSNGQIIEAREVTGQIIIQHSNVTVRDCIIHCTDFYGISTVGTVPGLKVLRTTIIGNGCQACILPESADATEIAFCDLSDAENGIFTSTNNNIHDNYIHDLSSLAGDPHIDGIQGGGDFTALTINHNTVISWDTSCIILQNEFAGFSGAVINDNLLIIDPTLGGAYGILCQSKDVGGVGTVSDITVTNNRIALGGTVGSSYGYFHDVSGLTWSGNVDALTGAPIDFDDGGGVTTPGDVSATAGSYAITGTAAAFLTSGNVTLPAVAGNYVLTGFPAMLAGKMTADAGSYLLNGFSATVAGKALAGAGAYALTGSPVTFTLTAGDFTLFCGSGSYALSGSDVSFPGYDPAPPVQPSTGGGYTGGAVYDTYRLRKKRKRDEIEELIDAVIQAPPPRAQPLTAPQPPPPALVDLLPKMEAAGLTPSQRKIVKRAIVTDDPDDDEEAIELLLNLLS